MAEPVLITGGCGFIGSSLCRYLVQECAQPVVNVDALTYAATPDAVAMLVGDPNYAFEKADIRDGRTMRALLERYRPMAIMHLAAESHVDRSIDGPGAFIETNSSGTYTLLEAALDYWRSLATQAQAGFRFHHVSTDEVYGALGPSDPPFTERHAYQPNSPYAASKAAADHLVRAWYRTYGLPVVLTNCSNNYGPWQYPEKMIPVTLTRALRGESLPVYGRGENVRDWLYVGDHARALRLCLQRGRVGEVYNIGGRAERRNIDLVRTLCRLLDEAAPLSPFRPHEQLIAFVADRPGHDFRYAVSTEKIAKELGWAPAESFDSGMARTVDWYLKNRAWWDRLVTGRQADERLGLAR